MTDVHCHVARPGNHRQFLAGRDFIGIHPWETLTKTGSVPEAAVAEIAWRLEAEEGLGVGEIGLDRLKSRDIPPVMREIFAAQLELAAKFRRPVILHGAKCWGQVVAALAAFAGKIPSFLFHGFSRSDGLIADIVKVNGFISVGPAILNAHAVNYRALAAKIPADRLLVETDRTEASGEVSARQVLEALARVRGVAAEELERVTDENAERFFRP
jgi:TatD DNase family protein